MGEKKSCRSMERTKVTEPKHLKMAGVIGVKDEGKGDQTFQQSGEGGERKRRENGELAIPRTEREQHGTSRASQ